MYLLNVLSLVLGLLSWALPLIAYVRNLEKNRSLMFLFISMTSCIISLVSQMLYQRYLAIAEAASAIFDTMPSVALVSATLGLVTIALNGVVMFNVISQKK